MNRFDHLDMMKAVGILLVVIGHAPGLDPYVKAVIYAFHMPLFFFVSGLLLSEQKLALAYKPYLLSLWRSLGIPYLFFFFVSYLYWLPTQSMTSRAAQFVDTPWWEPLLGVAIGNGQALFVNVVLWFFMCLFMTAIIYFAARKYLSAKSLFLVLNFFALFFVLLDDRSWPRLPWALDNAAVALSFYATGHYFRQYQDMVSKKMTRTSAIFLALCMLLGVAYTARINGEVDLNTLLFGTYPVLFFVGAYLGIFALFYFSISLPINAIFRWLSKNTIIIFPTHLLMFSIFTGISVMVFGLPPSFKESSIIWTILFPVAALILSYPTSWFLYRYLPFIFEQRQADRALLA